jgi:RNA 3'-terminal phosphate cyclase (ATP)
MTDKTLLQIDGNTGEGGGQILRTSLALSCITGQPVHIENIRAKRDKPGLLRQHLAAVNAAVAISHAQVEGNALGSQTLSFRPGKIHSGEYRFVVGSAGSALLVLQTILLPLLHADAPSTVTLEGGTHNTWAPPFPFIEQAFLPLLREMGYKAEVRLERAGFYPAGGGIVVATLTPGGKRHALDIGPRTEILQRVATGIVAHLPRAIAETEVARIREKLELTDADTVVLELDDAPGVGNAVYLNLRTARLTEVFTAFGERGKPATFVADEVVTEARRFLKSEHAAVGEHLADQLLLPMALAKGGVFTTLTPTSHTQTNIEIIRRFLSVDFSLTRTGRIDHLIEVKTPKAKK